MVTQLTIYKYILIYISDLSNYYNIVMVLFFFGKKKF